MKISREVKGELFMGAEVLTWAFFPIFVKISSGVLPVFFFTGISMIIAGITTLVIIFFKKNSFNFHSLPWQYMASSIFFLGIVFFPMLIFAGQHTTAGNMAILGQNEVLFSFLFFGFLGIDKVNKERIFGVGFILLGVILVLIKDFSWTLNVYDFFIIGICMLTPFANYFQQKVVRKVPPAIYLCIRSFIAGFFLLALSLLIEDIPVLKFLHWKLLILNGIITFGISKIFWLEAIKRIDVSKALALSSTYPIITICIAFFYLDEMTSFNQIAGLFAIILGVYLITHHERNIAGQQI